MTDTILLGQRFQRYPGLEIRRKSAPFAHLQIPPLSGGIHLNLLSDFPGPAQEKVKAHPVYVRQSPRVQKKLRNGNLGIFATNSDLSEHARIDPKYYKTVFMFLSSYVHAHPFSMYQLAAFRAGEERSLHLISTVLRSAEVYLSLALRDFLSLVPDQRRTLAPSVEQLIELWCGVASEFSQPREDEIDEHA